MDGCFWISRWNGKQYPLSSNCEIGKQPSNLVFAVTIKYPHSHLVAKLISNSNNVEISIVQVRRIVTLQVKQNLINIFRQIRVHDINFTVVCQQTSKIINQIFDILSQQNLFSYGLTVVCCYANHSHNCVQTGSTNVDNVNKQKVITFTVTF